MDTLRNYRMGSDQKVVWHVGKVDRLKTQFLELVECSMVVPNSWSN